MPFRLEYAPSGRAGCKATECKKQGIKIDKGALRHGTFLEIQEHQSWAWKHWGCVTPVQIANLKKDIDENLEYLDGYEDLNDDDKAKIRQALTDGHVADEDWRYDVEMNRPGKKGFRSPAYKAQQKAEKKAAEEQDPSATPSRPVTKKRSRTKTEDNSENELAAEPVTKKKRARVKKENNVEIDACDVAEATPQKSRSQTKKRTTNKVNHETDGAEEPEKVRVSAKIKDEETPGNTPNPDISVLRKAKLQVKKPPTKVKEGVLENEDQTTEVGIVGEAILHGKSTSGKKKSASKVQAELVGQEGITNDIHGRNGANRAVKAKSGRKKKNVGIEGPAESFETSKETDTKPNTSIRITRSRTK